MMLLTVRMEIDFNQEPAKQSAWPGWVGGRAWDGDRKMCKARTNAHGGQA